jgi:hypothetical protein
VTPLSSFVSEEGFLFLFHAWGACINWLYGHVCGIGGSKRVSPYNPNSA